MRVVYHATLNTTMAELHEALTYLSPVNWEDVPRDNLNDYVSRCFSAAELLVNSVPPVPDGTPFHTATPHFTTPNSARSAKDVFPSPARPSPPDKDHGDLVKHWVGVCVICKRHKLTLPVTPNRASQ